MMNINDPITVNGKTYYPDEFYQRKLFVKGVEKTNFDDYDWVNVLVDHRISKPDSAGVAQAIYRYGNSADIVKFTERELPYYIDTVMTTVSDKKGNQVQIILQADFASIKEMELVPRNTKQTPKPSTSSTTKP